MKERLLRFVKTEKEDTTQFRFDSNRDITEIAIILQYGHATRNGGYVSGRDYINPAVRPILDDLADSLFKEVAG